MEFFSFKIWKVSFIVSFPFSSSDPIFNNATLGLSSGYNDVYNDAPIIEKSIKFFELHSIFAPKSNTTLIPFLFGQSADKAGLSIFGDSIGASSPIEEWFIGRPYGQSAQPLHITSNTSWQKAAVFNQLGSVELYYNNSKKIETSDSGVSVTGEITADSATIGGIRFPKTDGLNNQVIRTDGAGNLSFVSVAAISGNLDSEQVIGLVDSAYVQARTAAGTDSAATQAMIDSSITFQVDSAYIAARTTAGTDSAAIINLIDSAYVQARSTSQTIGTINNVKNDAFTGNASTTAFNLSVTPADSDDVLVFVNGVLQHTSTYSLSSNTITLDSAPDSSSTIDIRTHLIQSQNVICILREKLTLYLMKLLLRC